MTNAKESSGMVTALSVVGLVFGLIGMFGSFIPCIGSLAFFVGIPAALVSAIGVYIAKTKNFNSTFAIVAITISLIGVVISGFQYFTIISAGSYAKKELEKKYKGTVPKATSKKDIEPKESAKPVDTIKDDSTQKVTPVEIKKEEPAPKVAPIETKEKESAQKDTPPNLSEDLAWQTIKEYYETKSRYAGKYTMSDLVKIDILEQKNNIYKIRARYKYDPIQQDGRSARKRSGVDTKAFYVRWNGDNYEVIKMGY